MNYYKDKTAIVERGAKIGKGTKIWHFSHIMKGAVIGKNCIVGQNVFVGEGVRIGDNAKIQNNVSIYTGVMLDDWVFCGPSVVFTNVHRPRSLYPVNKRYKRTHIKEGATIGANATMVCGHNIGKWAFVGAGSVVTKDVPDFALVYGNPARFKGWVCKCGQRLQYVEKKKTFMCQSCKIKYKKIKMD